MPAIEKNHWTDRAAFVDQWSQDRWARDERFLEELVERTREHTLWVLHSLTFESPSPAHPVRDGKRDEWLREPELECKHGRLPNDRTDPCGCYSEKRS